VSSVPYREVPRRALELPDRPSASDYARPPRELFKTVPDHASTLIK
jgi:hypothetical protein